MKIFSFFPLLTTLVFFSTTCLSFTQESAKAAIAIQKLYLSLPNNTENAPNLVPQGHFSCTDKIFAVLETKHYKEAKHNALFKWIDPHGELRERVEIPFFVNLEDTRIWSWLSLKRGMGASVMQFIDSSAGLEEFIGEWKIEVWINNKKKEEVSFEVNC